MIALFELRYGYARTATARAIERLLAEFLAPRSRYFPSTPKTPRMQATSAPISRARPERRSVLMIVSSQPRRAAGAPPLVTANRREFCPRAGPVAHGLDDVMDAAVPAARCSRGRDGWVVDAARGVVLDRTSKCREFLSAGEKRHLIELVHFRSSEWMMSRQSRFG